MSEFVAGEAPGRPASPPPPPDEPPVLMTDGLPDYRAMAAGAKTAAEFDYAAYMALRDGNGYSEVERVTRTRESLFPEWRPSTRGNEATLLALEVYRDKRGQAEGRGEATREAHVFAQREARNRYAREMGE